MTEEPRVPTSVGVIQADREAAAALMRVDGKDWGAIYIEATLAGDNDSAQFCQAFARHREASSTSALDERERLREALTQAFAIVHEAPELNMSNYDHDDVAAINGAMIELHGLLGSAIRSGDAG